MKPIFYYFLGPRIDALHPPAARIWIAALVNFERGSLLLTKRSHSMISAEKGRSQKARR